MSRPSRVPVVSASHFGIVLGLAGLGSAWRAAHAQWGMPAVVGEALSAAAASVWFALLILYGIRWILAPGEALAEWRHPIRCCFVGLIGVATMLVAGASLPYSREAAVLLFVPGAVWTAAFAIWRTGGLWRGGRDQAETTAILYLPTVAGSFVMAIVAAALGYGGLAQMAFGAGLFSWLAIESVLLNRLYTAPALAIELRATLGIQLAPPAVGAVAYLSVTSGPPDLLVHCLIGYAVLQALILLRLLPWLREQPFSLGYWAFTFGASALATAPLKLVARGDTGAVASLAPWLFIAANVVIGLIAAASLRGMAPVRGGVDLPRPASTARMP